MMNQHTAIPDHTAVRVALWRAIHVMVDAHPHIFEDEIGLQLVAPDENWRKRPDMDPLGTRGYRASIVGRARFVEDLVQDEAQKGVSQYIILGAGLDTFAQRKKVTASQMQIFEIDKPETQAWKRNRLMELGLGIPSQLHFVPVDFEGGDSWWEKLKTSGFKTNRPAVIASTGVAMYLTREANLKTLREIASLTPGSTLAMSFMLPVDLVDPEEQAPYKMIQERARAGGTPFLSFFRPSEILALAREAGFREAKHMSRNDLIQHYFLGRSDGLLPASGEEFMVATTHG